MSEYKPGQVLEGRVDNIKPYGCFIELPDGRVGLMHVSKMGHGWVENPRDIFDFGEGVEVRVLRDEGERIQLAMQPNGKLDHAPAPSLEPMLEKFLTQSNQRQKELGRNRSRRAGGER